MSVKYTVDQAHLWTWLYYFSNTSLFNRSMSKKQDKLAKHEMNWTCSGINRWKNLTRNPQRNSGRIPWSNPWDFLGSILEKFWRYSHKRPESFIGLNPWGFLKDFDDVKKSPEDSQGVFQRNLTFRNVLKKRGINVLKVFGEISEAMFRKRSKQSLETFLDHSRHLWKKSWWNPWKELLDDSLDKLSLKKSYWNLWENS